MSAGVSFAMIANQDDESQQLNLSIKRLLANNLHFKSFRIQRRALEGNATDRQAWLWVVLYRNPKESLANRVGSILSEVESTDRSYYRELFTDRLRPVAGLDSYELYRGEL